MKSKVLLVAGGIIAGLILALISAEAVGATSGDKFCSSCHSMERMTLSYHSDVHGGNNKSGFKAKCADCHLPHNNVANYMVAKAITGVKDVVGEIFYADGIDWVSRLENRKDYTYSSGCEKCHDLDAMKYEVPKGFLAHKDYKMGKVDSCIECHKHSGHKDLEQYLSK